MINEYSLLWRRLVTLAASCWGRWRGPHSPHYSGVKPIGRVHKFHHIEEQNVIGSARIACLCLTDEVGLCGEGKREDMDVPSQPQSSSSFCHARPKINDQRQ